MADQPKEKKKRKAEGKSKEAKPVETQPTEDKSKQAKPSEVQPPIVTEDSKLSEPKAKRSESKPSSRKASSVAEGEPKRKGSSVAPEGEPKRKGSSSVAAEGDSSEPRRKSSAVDPDSKQESRKSISERKSSRTQQNDAPVPDTEEEEDTEDTVEPMDRKLSIATEAERQRKRDSVSLHSKADMLKDLDEDKLKELAEAFMLFDMDGDGYINVTDLKQTFVTLGQTDIQDEELKKMLSEASNPMDFDSFVLLLGFRTIALDPEEILVEALSQWDYNNSGLISEERIKHDLMTWGDKFSQHEVDWALEEAPTHVTKGHNVMIDYVKFCKTLCGLRKKTRAPVPEDFMS